MCRHIKRRNERAKETGRVEWLQRERCRVGLVQIELENTSNPKWQTNRQRKQHDQQQQQL